MVSGCVRLPIGIYTASTDWPVFGLECRCNITINALSRRRVQLMVFAVELSCFTNFTLFLDSNSHCNTRRRYVTATQHHIARNNGFHRQMCGLMMKMQCVGRTYQETIARAILWFCMVRVCDGFQPQTRLCHTCLP